MDLLIRLVALIILFGYYCTFDVPRREKIAACLIASLLMIIGVLL